MLILNLVLFSFITLIVNANPESRPLELALAYNLYRYGNNPDIPTNGDYTKMLPDSEDDEIKKIDGEQGKFLRFVKYMSGSKTSTDVINRYFGKITDPTDPSNIMDNYRSASDPTTKLNMGDYLDWKTSVRKRSGKYPDYIIFQNRLKSDGMTVTDFSKIAEGKLPLAKFSETLSSIKEAGLVTLKDNNLKAFKSINNKIMELRAKDITNHAMQAYNKDKNKQPLKGKEPFNLKVKNEIVKDLSTSEKTKTGIMYTISSDNMDQFSKNIKDSGLKEAHLDIIENNYMLTEDKIPSGTGASSKDKFCGKK